MKNFLHQLAIELRAEVLTSLSANQRLAFALTCLDMHELAGVFTKNDVSNNLKSVFGVRGSRKLLKLMRETEGALTGYFAFRIYTALNNRPTLPPKIIEIVTPWRSMPDYDILLSHLGWVSLGSSQASNMLSATVRRIEIYVHIETGFLLSISGTRGSNIIPCVLSRQVSILCCVVTPNKVQHFYPTPSDRGEILTRVPRHEDPHPFREWFDLSLLDNNIKTAALNFLGEHTKSPPHKVYEALGYEQCPMSGHLIICSHNCPALIRMHGVGQGTSVHTYYSDGKQWKQWNQGSFAWSWWASERCNSSMCIRTGLKIFGRGRLGA